MTASCLIVASEVMCHAASRMPRALASAAFDVALLAPRDSLAEKSRHIGRVGHLPDHATAGQWLFAFAAMAKAIAPSIVLPADDIAYNLLQAVVTTPPPGMQPAMYEMLSSLVRQSLGEPAHYRRTADARALHRAAAELGLDIASIVAAARIDGAPVARESVSYTLAAWNGVLVAGWASRVLRSGGDGTSAAVARRYRDPVVRRAAARLVDAFGVSGLVEISFSSAPAAADGAIEVRRCLPATAHTGLKLGIDLPGALRAALQGESAATRSDVDEGAWHDLVRFPDEWLRDPYSPWLRQHPVDIPWDEPELFEALLALGPQPA